MPNSGGIQIRSSCGIFKRIDLDVVEGGAKMMRLMLTIEEQLHGNEL
jgi:hypothetical protein